MVIQRWQSVLLLISVILVALAGILPFASNDAAEVCASQAPILLTVDILVAVLLFIDIFLYRNLRFQMKVTRLCLGLIVVLGATVSSYAYGAIDNGAIAPVGGIFMPVLALVSTFAALRFMRRDYRLLRSADRLR